ncbi:MAG: four helix bundle protein [Bacteroidota bacterium]
MSNKTTTKEDLKNRTKQFALRSIKVFQALPKTDEARVIGKQFLRSSTSVAANYRAVCRARSMAEFVAKLGIVIEEADETVLWLELLIESGIISEIRAASLLKEANEILFIMSASKSTIRENALKSKNQKI